MKILAIGDLHGRKPRIPSEDFDCIIQVGDICSDKELAPWTKKWFKYLKMDSGGFLSLEKFLTKNLGGKGLKKMEEKSLKIGRQILEYLNSFGKPVFVIPGNWDQSYGKSRIRNPDANNYSYLKSFYDWWLGSKINPKLIGGLDNVVDCQYKIRRFEGINIVGYGLVSAPESLSKRKKKITKNLTAPQIKKLDGSYNKIIERLDSVFKRRDGKLPLIFLSHNIPYGTKLDTITDKKSYAYKRHLGSDIANLFCKKYQPLLCLGGHIHDWKGKDKIGKTTVINPGFGAKALVLIEIDEIKGRIKRVKFLK